MTNLIHGDCLIEMDKLIEQGIKVDLTVTSPPYDNLRTYEGSLDWGEYIWKPVIEKLYQITKDGGVVVWVVGDATIKGSESGTSFKQALYFMEVGFKISDTMIYQKHNPTPNTGNGKRYQQSFEYMFVFSKGIQKTSNLILEPRRNTCDDKRTQRIIKRQRNKDGEFEEAHLYVIKENIPRSNIWNYKVGLYNTTSDKEAFSHPAIFPESLAKDHILSWSNEGDTVFDPFMGSGTTGKMAITSNREFIGIELVEKYFNISKKRVDIANKNYQPELF